MLFFPLLVSSNILKIREGFSYTTFSHYISFNSPFNFVFTPWANFDGVYYLYIAGASYTRDNAGFFPLFPMLIKILSLNASAFSALQFFVALILSSLLFLFALVMFYKLLKLDFNHNSAISAIIMLLVFPTSFFFAAVYSESLFLLLTVLSFYFARKGDWFLSSIFSSLLTATRIVGIAIIPALFLEFYLQKKTLLNKKIISLFVTPLGILGYSLFSYSQWGTPLQFLKAQGMLHNSRSVDQIILFPQTVFRYFKILSTVKITYEWWIAMLEISVFFFALSMLFYAWRKKVRISYLIFSVLAFLIPTQSGTFSGMPRYVLLLFPMFIGLSLIKNKIFRILYVIVSATLLFILFALFSKGYFVA